MYSETIKALEKEVEYLDRVQRKLCPYEDHIRNHIDSSAAQIEKKITGLIILQFMKKSILQKAQK